MDDNQWFMGDSFVENGVLADLIIHIVIKADMVENESSETAWRR